MGTVTGSAHINKPVAEVFAFMTDSANWPDVEVGLLDIQPRGKVAVGSKGTETRDMRGRKIQATWEVAELEANKKLTVNGGGPGMKVRAVTSFAQKDNGTDVAFTMDYWPQGLMMKLMSPMIKGQFKKDTAKMMLRMKGAVESKR